MATRPTRQAMATIDARVAHARAELDSCLADVARFGWARPTGFLGDYLTLSTEEGAHVVVNRDDPLDAFNALGQQLIDQAAKIMDGDVNSMIVLLSKQFAQLIDQLLYEIELEEEGQAK